MLQQLFHVTTIISLFFPTIVESFQSLQGYGQGKCVRSRLQMGGNNECNSDSSATSRRLFLSTSVLATTLTTVTPKNAAFAGIDVSGIRLEGGGDLASQVKQQQLASSPPPVSRAPPSLPTLDGPVAGAATNVRRVSGTPKLIKTGSLGTLYKYEDTLVAINDSRRFLYVSFEFPSDWLQLDRILGGIQYVDQRNGDKLYVLNAPLPEDTSLTAVPKAWFGDVIFNPTQGTISKSGNTVDEYRVSSATTVQQIQSCGTNGACSVPTRRLTLKYATVTGNGYRVERRALVSAYEVNGIVYMVVTSSNGVKFDAKGKERETVEAIVDSFRIQEA